jgi:Lrp/AsnC family transcriptional regulator of ectoine degradation
MEFDEVLSCWSVGGSSDYILKILVTDVLDYQALLRKISEADIGLRRHISHVVLNTIKDSEVVPEGLIRQSDLVK